MDFSFKTNNNKEKKELPSIIKPKKGRHPPATALITHY